MSQSQNAAEDLLPRKAHSLVEEKHDLWLGRARSGASQLDDGDQEDMSLELDEGENWLCLGQLPSDLLPTQTSVSSLPETPHVSIHPLNKCLLSSNFVPPSINPGHDDEDEASKGSSLKGACLMIDIDHHYCTVKDMRLKPPSANEEENSDDISHYRFSICRKGQHSIQMPSTWEHISFTRRLFHLKEGDRLVLWETTDSDRFAKPTTGDIRCVWQHNYNVTIETETDEGDMMVSQLEVDESQTQEDAHNSLQDQIVLTQPSVAPPFTQPQSSTSAPLLTQPESLKKPEDDNADDDDDDDDTIDPLLGKPTISRQSKKKDEGSGVGEETAETGETQKSLKATLKDCIDVAQVMQKHGDLVETPKIKPSQPLDKDDLRSPDLLGDSSVEGDNNDDKDASQNASQNAPVNLQGRFETNLGKEPLASILEEKKEETGDRQRDSQDTVAESESSLDCKVKSHSKNATKSESASQGESPPDSNSFKANLLPAKDEMQRRGRTEAKETVSAAQKDDGKSLEVDASLSERDARTYLSMTENHRPVENMDDNHVANSELQEHSIVAMASKGPIEAAESGAPGASGKSSQTLGERAGETQNKETSNGPLSSPKSSGKSINNHPETQSQGVNIAARIMVAIGGPSETAYVNQEIESQDAGDEIVVGAETGDEAKSAHNVSPLEAVSEDKGPSSTDGNKETKSPTLDERDEARSATGTAGPTAHLTTEDAEQDGGTNAISVLEKSCPRQQQEDNAEKSEVLYNSLDRKRLRDDTADYSGAEMTVQDQDVSIAAGSEEKPKPTETNDYNENECSVSLDEKSQPEESKTATTRCSRPRRGRKSAAETKLSSVAQKKSQKPTETPDEPALSGPKQTEDDVTEDIGNNSQTDRKKRRKTRHSEKERKTESPKDVNAKKRKQESPKTTSSRTRRRTNTPKIKSATNKKAATRPTCRRNSAQHGGEESEGKSEEVYLLVTGSDLSEKEKAKIKDMGMTILEEPDDWSKVTHLVVEDGVEARRTPKVMLSMCQASYVVTIAWLRKCLDAGEVLPVASRVGPEVKKHRDKSKRITAEALERSIALRNTGKRILSDCTVSIFKKIAGTKAPDLKQLQNMVEGAGGVWLGEGIPPAAQKVDGKHVIMITSDPCTRSQKRELETSGDGVIPKTTTWLFGTFMSQTLDI